METAVNEQTRLDLHFFQRYLCWSAGMKELITTHASHSGDPELFISYFTKRLKYNEHTQVLIYRNNIQLNSILCE